MKDRGPRERSLRKRLLVVGAIVLLALAAWAVAALMWHAPIAPAPPLSRASFAPERVVWGEQLAVIGNCSGCHTTRDGAPYAGGVPMATPFGTVMGSNLTPEAETGIGLWSEAAFVRAMLGAPEARVHCIHAEGSGCYGHNGADDVAADAALLARAWPGKPVRVQWMREDEVWSSTHSSRPGGAGDLLAATHLARPFAPTPTKPLPQPERGGDRNAVPLYAVPQLRVVHHFLPQMPLRVSALRSLGAYLNVFAIESFMDELARAAHVDPVVFRLGHMPDARAQEVMRLAADRFGWARFKRSPLRGRGFAFARYKNLAAYAAIACEVEVRRDSGEVVNPDGICNQMEGGIVQSLSWTTLEAVTFDSWRVTSLDWGAYPILRFPQVPEQLDVHIIDRPGQPFLGTGEAAQGPAAAAIANAVADATGVRIRDLPLSRSRLRAAVGP